MNPREIFCPNMDCPARGQTGKGNIHVHSRKDERYCCTVCGQTFTTSQGTIFYRLRTDPQIVMWVVVLLAYGCPVQAIVKTFELDERTVSDWYERAGNHCQRVHEHQVENRSQDLQQVQADEIKVKARRGGDDGFGDSHEFYTARHPGLAGRGYSSFSFCQHHPRPQRCPDDHQ